MPENDAQDRTQAPSAEQADETQAVTAPSPSEQNTTDPTEDQSTPSEESATQEAEDAKDDTPSESEEDDDDALVPLSKLKKVRSEARNLRDRLKTAEARITELEAGKSSGDALTQIEALTKELRMERLSHKIAQEATKVGAIEPSAVTKLIDLDTVTWENNAPTNIDAVLAAAKESYPKLFAPVAGTGNIGNRSERGGQDEPVSGTARMRNAYSD